MDAANRSGQGYSISDLASELGITASSIRYYEKRGLLAPRRTRGNHRLYDRHERARLKLILRGKHFGYSLDEIARMIGFWDTDLDELTQIDRSLAFGERKLAEIRARIREIQALEQELVALAARMRTRRAELARNHTKETS
ncbi:MAG TPA: MerR family transcriptional regulator [Gammaproteobacteria bacterium]|nr:MerR family transcriptional regulator [Gammaproteobacteria bacterium]